LVKTEPKKLFGLLKFHPYGACKISQRKEFWMLFVASQRLWQWQQLLTHREIMIEKSLQSMDVLKQQGIHTITSHRLV